jgi:serine/threonine-protein kinase RsbW
VERSFAAGDIVGPTAFVIDHARRAGLTEEAGSSVAAAAGEIVMAAVARGTGLILVAAWTDEEGDFVCQIESEGTSALDPLAGYGPPVPGTSEGWGLWLARHFSDLLEVGIGSQGTAVRLRMRRFRA